MKPIEAVGAFLSSIGGEDSEDDDVEDCEHCKREKAKQQHRRSASTSKSTSKTTTTDKVSQLRDSVRLHKPHGNEANNALRHAKLGRALHSRFELHGDPHDLDEAIAQLSTAMALLPPTHKHRPMYESNVGLLLCVRYEHTHAEKDLDKAIASCRHSLSELDSLSSNAMSAEDKAWYQANLATALLHRYERHKQMPNLEESLTLWKTAISALPDGHPDKPSYQSNLAAIYLARYQINNHIEDLDRAISAIRAAIRGTPQDDMHYAVYKYMASSLYHRRWTKSQQPGDIDRAIDAGRAALLALPNKHRYSSKYQAELASKLLARYDQSGKIEDVNEAIELSKDAAVTFAHSSYPAERSTTPINRLSALALAFSKRFEKTDDIADLDEAIKHARQAVQMADKGRSPDRHTIHFTLSSLIYTRFERLGKVEDLDDSISHLTIAVDATPGSKSQTDRESLAEKLSTLSSHHLTRFEFQRTSGDLDLAVSYAKTALDLKKAGDGDGHLNLTAHPGARYALALALFRRFEQTGDMKDLDGALKNAQLAYDAVAKPNLTLLTSPSRRASGSHSKPAPPPGEPDSRKILYQSLLSGVLCARYKRLGEKADLDAAIAHAEAILAATPPDHPLYDMYKSIHSFALLAAAPEETGITPDDAIGHAREEAERAQSARDPTWGLKMLRYCNLLYARYERSLDAKEAEGGDEGVVEGLDLEHALQNWRRLATSGIRTIPSPPSVRFRAALKWADVACREGEYKSAVEAYKVAMSLAPRVALARLKGAIEDHPGLADAAPGEENELLLNTFSLASDCAAAALERGNVETAIEFLEQARSLIWRDALGIPSELDNLQKVNPGLADHVVDVLVQEEQMNGAPHASPISPLIKPSSNLRTPWMNSKEEKLRAEGTADDKWKSMVGTVRASEPAFGDFMRPWSMDSMREENATLPVGPVVLLNSSYLRCDAIILASTSEPVIVPLNEISKGDLERLAAQLVTGVKKLGDTETTGFEFDKAFLEPVLKELWSNVVHPIMQKLDDVAIGASRNVGWIPTGAFTWLPLHAAAAVGESVGKRKESDEDETAVHLRYGSKYSFYYATTLQSLLRPPIIDNSSHSRVLVISDQPSRRASLLGGDVTSIHALKSQLKGHKESGSDDGRSSKNSNIHVESLEAASAPTIFKALHPPPSLSDMEEEATSSTEVDAIHFSSPIFCDALRPSNSSWRIVDGGVIRVSDLFNSWFFYSSMQNGNFPPLPRLVFSSTTSYRLEGPTRSGTATEGKIRLPQELMSPEAALQFAGVRGVIGQIWSTKSEDATTIANHIYSAAVNAGAGEEKRIFAHPITGRITTTSRKGSLNGRNTPGTPPRAAHAGAAGAVWDTRGFEEGVAALRAAHVPLFRTVPFVRYGP